MPKLSFPAVVLLLVGGLTLPAQTSAQKRWGRGALALATMLTTAGLLRFVLLDALPGVIAGGRAAVEKQAVSTLRGIIVAQDYARTHALRDTDGDGVGEALTLSELAGYQPVGGALGGANAPLHFPEQDLIDTRRGKALRRAGYLVQVCLPVAGDEFDARRSSAVDPELAERRYLLYAWPEQTGKGRPQTVYFADEHERILQLPDPEGRIEGPARPPDCAAALVEPGWTAWKDKKPKAHLVGDSPAGATSHQP